MKFEALIQIIAQRKSFDQTGNRLLGYSKVINTTKYSLYRRPKRTHEIIAAFQDIIVMKCSDTVLKIVPNVALSSIAYKIRLTDKSFPGLIKDSKILNCQLIPYLRFIKDDTPIKAVRLCVFTDKGQIYHNYPNRGKDFSGYSKDGDIIKFEESVVWDLPERKYPSKNRDCSETEYYFPYLPNTCYEYHPRPNSDSAYKDLYGNGGFGISSKVQSSGQYVTVPRFYLHSRNINSNPFHFMGGCERDYKMTIIGTYRSNVEYGVRSCLFATDDGGRQWYCKYEFGDSGTYDFQQGHGDRWGRNFGNELSLDFKISHKVTVKQRELLLWQPNKFLWHNCGNAVLTGTNKSIELNFSSPHNLITGNIIAIEGEESLCNDILPLLNNTTSPTSAGNGILFKIEVINDKSVRLYEYVSSPYNNIPCRHIHHINPTKDGWFIGTGEIYPNGWLLFFQKKQSDTYQPCWANQEFNIYFLNHEPKSVQRTMGLLVFDDNNNTTYFASDHDTLERNPVSNKFPFSRSSCGVFRGALDDIDDRNKFECIFELVEPCYFFQKLDSLIVISGQRGEFVVSDLNFSSWSRQRIDNALFYYYGKSRQMHFFNNYILVIKE